MAVLFFSLLKLFVKMVKLKTSEETFKIIFHVDEALMTFQSHLTEFLKNVHNH